MGRYLWHNLTYDIKKQLHNFKFSDFLRWDTFKEQLKSSEFSTNYDSADKFLILSNESN
jgi:hypothetical protein